MKEPMAACTSRKDSVPFVVRSKRPANWEQIEVSTAEEEKGNEKRARKNGRGAFGENRGPRRYEGGSATRQHPPMVTNDGGAEA